MKRGRHCEKYRLSFGTKCFKVKIEVEELLYIGLSCVAFFCFLNSILTSTTDSRNAKKSATGPASSTPMIPKRSGSIKISGIRKNTCLVSANKAPFIAFPMAVKKLEQAETDCGDNQVPFHRKKICLPHTGKLLCTIVKAYDGLIPMPQVFKLSLTSS